MVARSSACPRPVRGKEEDDIIEEACVYDAEEMLEIVPRLRLQRWTNIVKPSDSVPKDHLLEPDEGPVLTA